MSTGTEDTRFGQRLKAQIDRYPVRLRPELASEAHRAHRRHRAARRAAAAAGTAVVIAAAVALAVTGTAPFSAAPGGQRPGPMSSLPAGGGIPPAGLQPAPPGDSLTAGEAARDIRWERTTVLAIPARYASRGDAFSYGARSRAITFYPDGQPQQDTQVITIKGQDGAVDEVRTTVDYEFRTWNRLTTLFLPTIRPSPCQAARAGDVAGLDFDLSPSAARSLVTCPGLGVTRGLTLDGIGAIKITGGQGETFWVNAATYVPIEIVIAPNDQIPARAYNNTKSPGEVIQFGYLPPTAANLAYLSTPIPAGFRGAAQILLPNPSLPGQRRPAVPRP